jgi:TonB family protein
MSKLLLLSSVGPRAPLVVSLVAHAAIAVAAVGGHGRGQAPSRNDEVTIDVEATFPPPLAVEPPAAPEPAVHRNRPVTAAQAHPHSHPYPLPPGHDDHPHDPSIDHREAAAATAVATAEPTVPHFAIVLGSSNAAAGGTLAAGGVGPAAIGAVGSGNAHVEDELTVTVPARLTSSGRPEYPSAAREAGLEADVPLEIVVDPVGHVVESRLLRRAGHGFDEAALRAIRTYRFTPAQHDGSPVRVRMNWTVAFRLE